MPNNINIFFVLNEIKLYISGLWMSNFYYRQNKLMNRTNLCVTLHHHFAKKLTPWCLGFHGDIPPIFVCSQVAADNVDGSANRRGVTERDALLSEQVRSHAGCAPLLHLITVCSKEEDQNSTCILFRMNFAFLRKGKDLPWKHILPRWLIHFRQ